MTRALPLILMVPTLWFGAAQASAAARIVSPTGASAGPCTEAAPCNLAAGLAAAAPADEVVLRPGEYGITTPVALGDGITLRGRDGAAATSIEFTSSLLVGNARLADLSLVTTTAQPLSLGNGAIAERLNVTAVVASGSATGVRMGAGALLRDSVVRATGTTGSIAVLAGSPVESRRAELRNVSAVATGAGSYGLYVNVLTGNPVAYTMRVRNALVRGVQRDVAVLGLGNQRLEIGSSAFRPSVSDVPAGQVTDLGDNIAAEPSLFAFPNDLHQLRTSPTVDRGTIDPLVGDTDIDGQPRIAGTGPDIGADEYPGPFAPPAPIAAGANLLRNGDAEAGPGVADAASTSPVPGWTTSPSFTAVQYDAKTGFPLLSESARIGGGRNFFAGGPNAQLGTAEQQVDVAGSAADIDAGRATVSLAADLGGFSTNSDAASVTATFRNAAGGALGSLTVGPVSAIERGADTVLLRRSASVLAPASTRRIDVLITARNAGPVGTYNDGYIDNVVLRLATPPVPSAPLGGGQGEGTPDATAPVISGARLDRRSFRRNASARVKAPRGVNITASLSEAAALQLTVERAAAGRRSRGACVPPTRTRRTPACTRWLAAGTITSTGTAGENRLRFTGIVGARSLAAGRYRLTLVATDAAGNRASVRVGTVTVKR